MLSVKGTFRDGVATPAEPIDDAEGTPVIITFLEVEPPGEAEPEPDERSTVFESLSELVARCQVNTGIGDLAHQHDHYLYGTPKKTE